MVKRTKCGRRRGGLASRGGAVGWLLSLACSAACAQDLASVGLDKLLDLEVTAASKFSLRVSESPSSATVIGADEIRALGYRTLAEALQSVRGLVVSSDRTYAYLGARGYSAAGDYNTRILLLIDGNRVNDTVYDQAFLGSEFPLDIDLIERIEFIPGQGSAVHGGNALFGVVNVVTRTAASVAGSEVVVSAGGARSRHLRASTSQRVGETGHLLVSAGKRYVGGSNVYYAALDTPAQGNGISRETDHEHSEQLYLKYVQGRLTTSLVHADRARGLSATPGTVFADKRTAYRDLITLADATLAHRLGEHSQLKLRVYGGRYGFEGDYVVDYPPVTLNRDVGRSRWWGVETNLFTQRYQGHKLVIGMDMQSSPRRDQSNADIDPASEPYLDDRRSSRRQSLFVEDQWTLSPAVSVTGGLRYDRIAGERTSSELSPRLALVSRPADGWVLKLIHGWAFRAPNAYESFYAIGGSVGYKGNPALENERVRGTEAVLEYRPSSDTRWTASAYDNRADKLLIQTVDPVDNLLSYNNLGSMRMQGVELEGERVWPNGAHLRGNYSVQRSRDTSDQNLADRAAARLAKLAVIVPVAEGWTVGTQTVLVSPRGNVAGYGVTHLTLSRAWSAAGRQHVSFSVYDVFDRRPDDPGSDSVLQPVSPQDGRNWRVQLNLAF